MRTAGARAGSAGLRSQPNRRPRKPCCSSFAGIVAGAIDARRIAGALGEGSAAIGAGCDGVMPFTSGSGLGGSLSALLPGTTGTSSAGTVTIS